MTLEKLPWDSERHTIEGTDVQIIISYDVLTEPGTRQYSKMGKKNGVSLIIMTIQNSGQEELNLTRDFIFQTSNGDTILPLTMEEAGESLVKPVTDEENTAFVQVEPPSGWIFELGKLVNDSKKVISHVRFANDMLEYYLEGRVLASGACIQGLLVLPVTKGTIVQISLR